MRFKDWLQKEVGMNFTGVTSTSPNSTLLGQQTNAAAKKTMATFGPKIIGDLAKASNPKVGFQKATTYAQKDMDKSSTKPGQNITNVGAVGAQVYKMATGNDPKIT
jgi:hypothetical protein